MKSNPPFDDSPSGVDLLAIFATIIDACALHLDAPREVNVLLSDRTMQTLDLMFLENPARDGELLSARGSPPAPLAA